MKKYFPLISSVFIIIAFFLWYLMGVKKYIPQKIEKNIVSIEEKKWKITITKSSDNIEIYLNKKPYQSEE